MTKCNFLRGFRKDNNKLAQGKIIKLQYLTDEDSFDIQIEDEKTGEIVNLFETSTMSYLNRGVYAGDILLIGHVYAIAIDFENLEIFPKNLVYPIKIVYMDNFEPTTKFITSDFTVVGNIIENPELIIKVFEKY